MRSADRYPTLTAPIGMNRDGTAKADRYDGMRSGGMPKKHAPSPSSTAVSSINRLAMPASMCQYGTGQRDSSRSVGGSAARPMSKASRHNTVSRM